MRFAGWWWTFLLVVLVVVIVMTVVVIAVGIGRHGKESLLGLNCLAAACWASHSHSTLLAPLLRLSSPTQWVPIEPLLRKPLVRFLQFSWGYFRMMKLGANSLRKCALERDPECRTLACSHTLAGHCRGDGGRSGGFQCVIAISIQQHARESLLGSSCFAAVCWV